jgi:hypothetical protein
MYVAALCVAVTFALAVQRFGVLTAASQALETSRGAARVMRDASVTDDVRERAAQRASLSLLRSLLSILGRAATATGVSLLPLLAFEVFGLADWTGVLRLLSTTGGILLASVAMVFTYFLRIRN